MELDKKNEAEAIDVPGEVAERPLEPADRGVAAESGAISKPAPQSKPPMRFQANWAGPLIGAAVLLVMVGRSTCREMHDGPILRDGTPAKARVVAIEPTGNSYNDDQEVRLDLDVQPEGEETYRAKVELYLHPVHFARYQPGNVVDVRFDPKKRRDVVLVPP